VAIHVTHIWLGRFMSGEAFDAYFEETYSEDDYETPISRFAEDQRVWFYDHDGVECSFNDAGELRSKIEPHSYSESYLDIVMTRATEQGITDANVFIMADQEEFEAPKSVTGADYQLWYLGTVECET
jgi:hypothetical protein